eukprot:1566655-Prymnesium_polylepis.1
MKQQYISCIALLYISGYITIHHDTSRYSDTAIQRDTAYRMYHHPSDLGGLSGCDVRVFSLTE